MYDKQYIVVVLEKDFVLKVIHIDTGAEVFSSPLLNDVPPVLRNFNNSGVGGVLLETFDETNLHENSGAPISPAKLQREQNKKQLLGDRLRPVTDPTCKGDSLGEKAELLGQIYGHNSGAQNENKSLGANSKKNENTPVLHQCVLVDLDKNEDVGPTLIVMIENKPVLFYRAFIRAACLNAYNASDDFPFDFQLEMHRNIAPIGKGGGRIYSFKKKIVDEDEENLLGNNSSNTAESSYQGIVINNSNPLGKPIFCFSKRNKLFLHGGGDAINAADT